MRGIPLSQNDISKITFLRKRGHSISEISRIIGRGKSTISRYIQDVKILPKYSESLKQKQGGSRNRSLKEWQRAKDRANDLFYSGIQAELIILTCLYWGEGNKKELNLINSDPSLIVIFVKMLEKIGINRESLKVSIRLYEDIAPEAAILFWAKILEVDKDKIITIDVIKGKKLGKLKYGMCRIRVTKGGRHFKLIMSVIDLIKFKYSAAVV